MAILTSQQLSKYYDQFSGSDVTFTRDVKRALLLYEKQVFVKCLGYQWPVIIFSSSMTSAKVILNYQQSLKQIIEKAGNMVALRYSFIVREKPDPVSFYVNAKVVEDSPYSSDNPDLHFVSLSFNNRPPDDLIERLGLLLDAHSVATQRKEDRILLSPEALKELKLDAKSVSAIIDHVPRKCILRDLSFSAIRLIIMGVPAFFLNKDAIIKLHFNDPDETLELAGKVLRFEPIEGRQDLGVFVIQFNEATIPVEYKLRLNEWFKQLKSRKALPVNDKP